ncbi:hypothetical protein ABZ215_24825 [Amycolatopsis sp. NPDC006131]|uniref:hypothetical protein n=1 Tax=Amycolatopsis sp. NPDC006131 TaxID=3156731 RepID=UPI00339E5336
MTSPVRPPEYGSPEWLALAKDDPRRREAVQFAADCWRLLTSSPHVAELLGEWVEWMHRRTMREASWRISAAVDWSAVASAPTFAELARRRAVFEGEPLSAVEVRRRARESWAVVEREIAAKYRDAA